MNAPMTGEARRRMYFRFALQRALKSLTFGRIGHTHPRYPTPQYILTVCEDYRPYESKMERLVREGGYK